MESYFLRILQNSRYNMERLCNHMRRVERLTSLKEPIKEAYFPKLDSLVASRSYPARVANQAPSNLNREVDQIQQDIDDMERWRDRIFAAIHQGYVENVGFKGFYPDILSHKIHHLILNVL